VISAPIEAVFRYASNWRNWPSFFEGVSDFKPTTATTRGNGARYAYKAKMLGIKASVETEITEFIENGGWVGIAAGGIPHRTQWIFESASGQTRFTFVQTYRIPIPVFGALLDRLFVRPAWEKIVERSLANLKALTENIDKS